MRALHIGLDLDNTIIDFEIAFVEVSRKLGLLQADEGVRSKAEVKSRLLRSSGGQEAWMRLQGQVYGHFIEKGRMQEGLAAFLDAMRRQGARVSIVSHKTPYGHFDAQQISLRDAARAWLDRRGFFAPDRFGLARGDLHFFDTRDEKVAAIGRIGCDAFVDDLPEVLLHPGFPGRTAAFWFAPGGDVEDGGRLTPYRSWDALRTAIESLPQPR